MSHPSIYDGCFLPTVAIHVFEAEFFGKEAHAAIAPWDGINALDALIQAFNNINALRQSILPSMKIHGIILEGGKADNIIPSNHFWGISDFAEAILKAALRYEQRIQTNF
jgi:metal-dependent amidase/aminoacylase/carboxypeptidase family protein